MNKHTPWIVSDEREIDGNIYVEDPLGVVAIVTSQEHARLIVTAPELLDIAESILADDMLQFLPAEYVARVRAAITKATGDEK